MGAPKHDQPHPHGGSWSGHLVRVFQEVFPEGSIRILGHPVPERPELERFDDPRMGPARALSLWAASALPPVDRWWVVACDQVRWEAQDLGAWHRKALDADPEARAWVLAEHGGRLQYLGGFLGAALLPIVAASGAPSLRELAASLPTQVIPSEGREWLDVDSPEDRAVWRG